MQTVKTYGGYTVVQAKSLSLNKGKRRETGERTPGEGHMEDVILIADDEANIRQLLEHILAGNPRWRVLVASNGKEALELAQREKPVVAIMDVVMPFYQGWQVCEMLKASSETASIQVILISALSQDSHKRKALQAGAAAYLVKPFSPRELLAKVESLIGR